MEQITNYIKPELIVVAVVLYMIGAAIKRTKVVKDKYIPLILGAAGTAFCAVWVLANCPLGSGREIAMAVFTAVVQGILVAGASTYVNQVVKQLHKEE
nr:phage holin family protein [uncultured Sellimonas sp.]